MYGKDSINRQQVVNGIIAEEEDAKVAAFRQALTQHAVERAELLKMRLDEAEAKIKQQTQQINTYKACALEIAQELASVGSRDHKSKNEMLLHAIARLMAFSTNYPRSNGMDDIPF